MRLILVFAWNREGFLPLQGPGRGQRPPPRCPKDVAAPVSPRRVYTQSDLTHV